MLCQSDKEVSLANHQPIIPLHDLATDTGAWTEEPKANEGSVRDNFLSSSFSPQCRQLLRICNPRQWHCWFGIRAWAPPFTSGWSNERHETSTHIGNLRYFYDTVTAGSRSDYNLSLRSSFTSSSFLGCHPGPNESKAQDALECTTKSAKLKHKIFLTYYTITSSSNSTRRFRLPAAKSYSSNQFRLVWRREWRSEPL
jgi:hypothetical protein